MEMNWPDASAMISLTDILMSPWRYATPIRLFPSCCLWSVTNRKTLSASDATPKSTLMDMLRAQKNEFKAVGMKNILVP